jgi:hypothetical protein
MQKAPGRAGTKTGMGYSYLEGELSSDRLPWFICQNLELNTKSPSFICLTEDSLLLRSIGRESWRSIARTGVQ